MSFKSMFPAGKLPDKYKRKTPEEILHRGAAEAGFCPLCGAAVILDDTADVIIPDAHGEELHRFPAPVYFCSRCEFAVEAADKGKMN